VELLTNRDREFLRVIYMLNGSTHPVGPAALSRKIGVTKVYAFQKMHRLQAMGYGTYILHTGLKLNTKAIKRIDQDAKRHHILEAFLQENLGLTHKEACLEAEQLDQSMSQTLFNKIDSSNKTISSSCCEYDPNGKISVSDLRTCPWVKRLICEKKEIGKNEPKK